MAATWTSSPRRTKPWMISLMPCWTRSSFVPGWLGLAVFSQDFVAVAYPVVEERAKVPLKKSGQPHPDPDEFALFSPVNVSEDELG